MKPITVSHSKIKVWRKCRRLYHYKYVERLQRKTKGRPLMFGSMIHDALELKLAGKSPAPVYREADKELKKMFREERIALGVDGIVGEAEQVVNFYCDYYKNDGLKYLGVEFEFAVEVIPGVILEGFIDAIVQDERGDVWILERKTCKNIPEEKTRQSDVQTVVYRYVIPHLKIRQGRKLVPIPEVRGIIWDYVRSKVPTKPEVLKNGSISKNRNIDTIPAVYLAAVKEAGLDPKDYKEFLDNLKGAEVNFLRRIKLPFSKTLVNEVMEDFKESTTELASLHGKTRARNLGRDCSWCEFYNLCQTDLRGGDREGLLKHDYEVKKDNEKKNRKLRAEANEE